MTLKDLSSNQTDPQQNRALFGHLIVVVPAQQTQRLDLLPEPLRFLLTYIQRERITEQQILPRTCSSFSLQDEAELREKRWEDEPNPSEPRRFGGWSYLASAAATTGATAAGTWWIRPEPPAGRAADERPRAGSARSYMERRSAPGEGGRRRCRRRMRRREQLHLIFIRTEEQLRPFR